MSALARIIAEAIADGAPVADEMSAAQRVILALSAIGPKFKAAIESEPYQPVEYPKWIDGRLVHNADEEAALSVSTDAEEPAANPPEADPPAPDQPEQH